MSGITVESNTNKQYEGVVLVDPKSGLPYGAPGAVNQAVPDYESAADMLIAYGDFSEVNWAGGDFVTRHSTSNGQSITALSANPLLPGESRIVIDEPLQQPCVLEFEGAVIRNKHQFVSAGAYANADTGPEQTLDPINIVSIYQSSAVAGAAYTAVAGTTVTLVLETALPEFPAHGAVYLSDWINIYGLVDSRLNYQNAAINWFSPDRTVICFGFSDEVALPSLAIAPVTPVLGTAKVNFYNNAAGAAHGAGYRFTQTTGTSAVYWSVFGGGDAMVSGTLLGDHRTTCASTDPVTLNPVQGNCELKASSRYRIDFRPRAVDFCDRAVDAVATLWGHRVNRTSVKPGSKALLRPRYRIYQPVGMTRPVARTLSISKSGTTTATINLAEVPVEPIVVGNVIGVYGARDQTNFANATATVTAVLSPTQIQCILGSAVTATSYGGFVSIVNGGVTQPGIISMTGSTVRSGVSTPVVGGNPDWIEIVFGASVSGVAVGMPVNLHGWRSGVDGSDLGIDGVWEVAQAVAANVQFKPIYDIRGVRQSPITPNIPAAVSCGGGLIVRTTARIHDVLFSQTQEMEVMLAGQGTSRADLSMPVNLTTNPIATQGSPAAPSATDGSGAWFMRGAIVGIADIASAALTSTTTSASVNNALGNGFQVTFPVTAVTGTNQTLDIRIEESYDSAGNWKTLYDMERITANGSYNTPILRASGRNIRYVRTVNGTSPSFTHSATRTVLPFIQAEPQKRMIDRTVVLTTLNSVTPVLFSGAANNIQLVIKLGAATTPPAIQIEGSEDGQTGWYPIGAPLTGVASSTVQLTVNGVSATHLRARVSTAGVTVTPDYLSLKAWS